MYSKPTHAGIGLHYHRSALPNGGGLFPVSPTRVLQEWREWPEEEIAVDARSAVAGMWDNASLMCAMTRVHHQHAPVASSAEHVETIGQTARIVHDSWGVD